MSYLTQEEIKKRDNDYCTILDDTLSCWISTRLKNGSASMVCDGNISIALLHVFDTIHDIDVTKKTGDIISDALMKYKEDNNGN